MLSAHKLRPAEGLYDPQNEHDACGVAFVATLTGQASNDIVVKGLTALRNLDHRGAVGAEENTGDGAGMLLQMPNVVGFLDKPHTMTSLEMLLASVAQEVHARSSLHR